MGLDRGKDWGLGVQRDIFLDIGLERERERERERWLRLREGGGKEIRDQGHIERLGIRGLERERERNSRLTIQRDRLRVMHFERDIDSGLGFQGERMEDRSLYIQRESYGLNKQVIKGLEGERDYYLGVTFLDRQIDSQENKQRDRVILLFKILERQIKRKIEFWGQGFRERERQRDIEG